MHEIVLKTSRHQMLLAHRYPDIEPFPNGMIPIWISLRGDEAKIWKKPNHGASETKSHGFFRRHCDSDNTLSAGQLKKAVKSALNVEFWSVDYADCGDNVGLCQVHRRKRAYWRNKNNRGSSPRWMKVP
ncbi:hypothetical protein [Brucella sp. 22210]|uniref:hypothetical protein n=1 Tax=Brucella sp. 22210 TaxID=3453892 RepID=UPI003F859442